MVTQSWSERHVQDRKEDNWKSGVEQKLATNTHTHILLFTAENGETKQKPWPLEMHSDVQPPP